MLNIAVFALAVSLPAQGDPAPIPGDGILHIEAPDISSLLAAYRKAPLMQMIADESVGDTVGGILSGAGLQVGPAVSRALGSIGVPEAMAAVPLESLAGMLGMLNSASISASLSGETEQVSADLAGSIEAIGRISKFKEKVAEFMEANQGFPPGELGELDVPEEWLTDPWGNPYLIEVDIDSLASTIICLGADGASGGTGFATDLNSAESEERQITGLVTRTLDVVAQVEFTSDDSARVAWDQISGLLETHLGKRPDGRRELSVRGSTARVCEFAEIEDAGGAVWMLGVDRSIAVGFGRDSLGRAIARSQSETRGLTPSEQVGKVAEYLPDARGAAVVSGWAEFDRLNAVMEAIQSGAKAMGVDGIQTVPLSGSGLMRMQLDGDRFISEIAYNVHPDSPLATCAGAGPVPAGLWDFVPSESIGVYASSIDGKAIYNEFMSSLEAVPGNRPWALEQFEAQHGFSLEKDLIGNLGGGAAAYLLPISGVISIPGVAVVVELKDAEAFQRGLDAVLTALEEKSGGEFSVRYKPYRDQPMWTFRFGGEGGGFSGPISISPSLTIVKNHLLISLTSTRAKKEIKRLLEGEETGPHRLLSMPSGPPADAGSISFMDWPALVDGTYEGARAALTMFAGMIEDMPLDPEDLPSSTTFTRFFQPSVSWTNTVAPGVRLTHSESSFGPETLLGIVGGGGALALAVRDMQMGSRIEREVEVLNEDPEIAAVIEESMQTLDRLATRLEVYKIENGAYPGSLADLIKPSAKYPRGYLDSSEVPTDGWGRDFVYLSSPDRASYSLWSVGENGMDERGSADDLSLN